MKFSASKPLRIVVHHNLEEGGALRALRGFVEALRRRHHVRWALIGRPSGGDDAITAPARLLHMPLGSGLYHLHKWSDLWNLSQVERASRGLARRIEAAGFDVAFLHPCRYGQAPALLRYLRTPAIYYCPEPLRLYREAVPFEDGASRSWGARAGRATFRPVGRWLGRRDRALAARAGLLITNSDYSSIQIAQAYGRTTVVVSPGVDTRLFRPLPDRKRDRMVLTVGKLVERKGHFLAVRIVGAVPAERRPRLVVAGFQGSASYRTRLLREAEEREVDLTLAADLPDEALVRLYNQALATLSVSLGEPLGLVALESQSCGTPVLARDEAGHRETVIDGETGFLLPPDPARFAGKLCQLDDDPAMVESIGAAGRRHVERHADQEQAGKRLCSIVEEFAHGI